MTKATAPSRASGKLSINFALLSIPVDLFTATEEVSVKRSQYTAKGEKVGSAPAIKNDDGSYGDFVDRADIIKKFQTDSGVLIDLTDEEIDKAVNAGSAGSAQVVAFQPFGLLTAGAYIPNGLVWQVRASKLGTGRTAKDNPGAARALALILQALKAEQSFALLRFTKSGVPYFAALLPTGRLVGLYHDDEVRTERAFPVLTDGNAEAPLTDDEVAFARELISASRTAAVQELPHPAQRVRDYAEAKAKGEGHEVAAPVNAEVRQNTLLDTLKASVEATKAGAS